MGLAYQRWKPGSYPRDSYPRLKSAVSLNAVAAFLSASYGLGQIMGFNYKAAGHKSAQEMFETAQQGEYEQLVQLVTLMKSWNMVSMLTDKDFTNPNSWRPAVSKYNGKGYKKHGYHIKCANAYKKHSGLTNSGARIASSFLQINAKGELVRNLQADLQSLGYVFESGVDGRFGPETYKHVKSFQTMNNLKVDGVAGERTLAKLAEAVQQVKVDKSPAQPVFDKKGGWVELLIALIKGFF